MKSITIHTQLENGATPVFARIMILTKAELLELAETEVLLGTSGATNEAMVVWLTENEDTLAEDQANMHEKFSELFGEIGIGLDLWDLSS